MTTAETGPMPWDELYALATPKRAFSMLFNIVNVLRSFERRFNSWARAGRKPDGLP